MKVGTKFSPAACPMSYEVLSVSSSGARVFVRDTPIYCTMCARDIDVKRVACALCTHHRPLNQENISGKKSKTTKNIKIYS